MFTLPIQGAIISLGLKYYKLEYQGAMHQNRGPAGGWVIATIYFCN